MLGGLGGGSADDHTFAFSNRGGEEGVRFSRVSFTPCGEERRGESHYLTAYLGRGTFGFAAFDLLQVGLVGVEGAGCCAVQLLGQAIGVGGVGIGSAGGVGNALQFLLCLGLNVEADGVDG